MRTSRSTKEVYLEGLIGFDRLDEEGEVCVCRDLVIQTLHVRAPSGGIEKWKEKIVQTVQYRDYDK